MPDTEDTLLPRALILVMEHVPLLVAPFAQHRLVLGPHDAVLASFADTFSDEENALIRDYLADAPPSGSGVHEFLSEVADLLEAKRLNCEASWSWPQESPLEHHRRASLNIAGVTHAWVLDERYARACLDALAAGDAEAGGTLLALAGSRIAGKAMTAFTRKGRLLRIEHAIAVVKVDLHRALARHNATTVEWARLLLGFLEGVHRDM